MRKGGYCNEPQPFEFDCGVAAGLLLLISFPPAQAADGSASTWVDAVEGWQTGLGALVGLIGVAISVSWTAAKNRKSARHTAKLDRERDEWLREQDANALATELLTEVRAIKPEISRRKFLIMEARNLENVVPGFLDRYQPLNTPIHDAGLSRLGLLGPELALEVEFLFGRLIPLAQGALYSAREAIYLKKDVASTLEQHRNDFNRMMKELADPKEIDVLRETYETMKQSAERLLADRSTEKWIDLAVSSYKAAEEYADTLLIRLKDVTGVRADHPALQSSISGP